MEQSSKSAKKLREIAESKVPYIFNHISAITDNQIYYIAMLVRNKYKDDYNKWHPVVTEALKDVHVTGCLDRIRTCGELIDACDVEVLKEYISKR